MKILISIFMLGFLNSGFAGTLDCEISKGYAGAKTKLIQTAFAEEDPEEETESYEVSFNNTVLASVEYAPYQNGVDLTLKLLKSGIKASSNYDQEIDDYMDLSMTDADGTVYLLTCTK